MIDIVVRPVTGDEILTIEHDLHRAEHDLHRRRLARQERGEATYLIAWSGSRAIGHLVVLWGGSGVPFVRERLDTGRIPDLADLMVAETFRGQGVGTRILDAAEAMARERGFDRVGIDIALDNPDARRLYERLGYAESGLGAYEIGASGTHTDGTAWSWREEVVYLVKRLGRDGSREISRSRPAGPG